MQNFLYDKMNLVFIYLFIIAQDEILELTPRKVSEITDVDSRCRLVRFKFHSFSYQ